MKRKYRIIKCEYGGKYYWYEVQKKNFLSGWTDYYGENNTARFETLDDAVYFIERHIFGFCQKPEGKTITVIREY